MSGVAEQDAARAEVVRIAREWIGTPFQHGARIKHVCCDCTFPAMVYEEAGIVPPLAIAPYSTLAHLHRAAGQYLQVVKRFAHEVPEGRPGDLVMYFIARDFSHSGIIDGDGWPWIVHADMACGAVIPVRGDQGDLARARVVQFWSPW